MFAIFRELRAYVLREKAVVMILIHLHMKDDNLHASIAVHVGLNPDRLMIVALPEMRLIGIITNSTASRVSLLRRAAKKMTMRSRQWPHKRILRTGPTAVALAIPIFTPRTAVTVAATIVKLLTHLAVILV